MSQVTLDERNKYRRFVVEPSICALVLPFTAWLLQAGSRNQGAVISDIDGAAIGDTKFIATGTQSFTSCRTDEQLGTYVRHSPRLARAPNTFGSTPLLTAAVV